MRKFSFIFAIMAMVLAFTYAEEKGPILDKILFDARSQQDIGIKEVAAGRSDLWNYGTDGAAFKALPDDVKSKLEVYSVTGVNQISLLLNPYPNKAPYTAAVKDGRVQFNPFAIREVRYAMNFLINRKKIIDEIMVGAGMPWFTPAVPGQPNSSRYGLIATRMGMTAQGNEKKALADIETAMKTAAALPENSGKLKKDGAWWTYDGSPVTVKFLIRVDDPTLRLPEGRYIADQIEKAGIKVERAELDRVACRALWGKSDPAEYGWNLYTEGWGGGQTYAFWESSISQFYAPWLSNMPGQGNAGFWNYENAELDKLTADPYNGRVIDTAEYYAKLLKATELGLNEAVRVFIAAQTTYLAQNRDRFNGRMVYGLGDGINKWSMYTADVKPEASGPDKGLKVMRMTAFSAQGSLFMSSWDPIGTQGFSDTYSAIIIKECSDSEFEANPVTGLYMPLRAVPSKVTTRVERTADGKLAGKIAVPKTAVLWNARTQKWEPGLVYADVKGDGTTFDYVTAKDNKAFSTATFTFKFGKWHHGRPVDINDYRYAISLPYDISCKKSDSDKVYEEEYANTVNLNLLRFRGYVFNKDGTLTSYGDSNYPMDKMYLAALLCPSLMVEGSNYGSIVCWEILEAVKGIVAEGSVSKTAWSYNSNSDFTEVDLLSPKCVADIRAKLEEYAAAKRVPAALAGFLKPDQAVKNYRMALDFIKAHNHAYISNGGFILDKYDPANNTGVMTANRDPSYPYAKGYFAKALATTFARIDSVKVATYKKGTDLSVAVKVSSVAFPSNAAAPASRANVKATLIADRETVCTAKPARAGEYEAMIPAKVLDALKPGSYTIIVDASMGTEAGAVETTNVIIF